MMGALTKTPSHTSTSTYKNIPLELMLLSSLLNLDSIISKAKLNVATIFKMIA